jgi:hypothetical protein
MDINNSVFVVWIRNNSEQTRVSASVKRILFMAQGASPEIEQISEGFYFD